ncbi:MAG: TVP38/TMEM64 family protein [Leptolyngbyaceae cyanobacterium]
MFISRKLSIPSANSLVQLELWPVLTKWVGVVLSISLVTVFGFWTFQLIQIDSFTPEHLTNLVDKTGLFGPLIYIGILALSVVISYIPGLPLAIAAGMIWGPFWAGVYSVIGGLIGAIATYYIGYFLGKPIIQSLTGKALYFSTHRGEKYIGLLIFVTRLLPVFSFDLISYAAGITGISLPIYCVATFFGMVPSTFLITYLGSFSTGNPSIGIGLTGLCLGLFLVLLWGAQTRNWFDLKNVIQYE